MKLNRLAVALIVANLLVLAFGGAGVALAATYLHTPVVMCDNTTATRCLTVNADGSINTASGAGSSGAFTDCSGTVATGGTAQNAIASSTGSHFHFILNPASASETLWINPTGTAAANGEATGSIALSAGQSFLWSAGGSYVPTNALSVVAATNAHTYTCSYA